MIEPEADMGANIRHKDSVFSFLFSDPDTLRELYGAIAGVTLPADLPVTINTLEGVLYKTLLNDISFEIDKRLVVLIEHQSTINPNLPVRLLLYIGRVYEKLITGRNIYGSKKFFIPRPEFIVLYNGLAPYPDKVVLRLSESFEDAESLGVSRAADPRLELTVTIYNINQGHNEGIAGRCEKLKGYSAFIAKVREIEAENRDREEAMEGAIKWCIGEGILKGFFETHGTEVVNMLMTEWKLEEALAVEWEEGREKGLEEGLEKGLEKGLEEGLEKGLEKTARNALAKGFSVDIIREITGLDEETIARLSQN
jgi:hypothetical protein